MTKDEIKAAAEQCISMPDNSSVSFDVDKFLGLTGGDAQAEQVRAAAIEECAALCETVGNDEYTNVHRVLANRIRALAAQPPAAPVGLDVLRQMVQRQRDIPGMPPQQTGRPSGSNADEWNCFLSEHLNSTSFLAVQIAEAIEDGEKRGSLSRSSAETARPHDAPEWLWYGEVDGKPVVTFGRWPKHGAQWRYKWAEIQPTEHDHQKAQFTDPQTATDTRLILAEEYEAGLRKMEVSGYEEWQRPIQNHKLVIEALRFQAHHSAPPQTSAGTDALTDAIRAKMAEPAFVSFRNSTPQVNEVGLLPVIKIRPNAVSDWIVVLPSGREIGLTDKEWKAASIPAQPQTSAATGAAYRQAIDEALVTRHLGVAKGNAQDELNSILSWEVGVALDPCVSEAAQALIDQGRAQPQPVPTPAFDSLAAEVIDRISERYNKLAASPLGMATAWERKASGGKPLLYGGKRGLLAHGTIATWDEFDLIADVINNLPTLLAACSVSRPQGK